MTRINCGIPVEELTDKHLLAETREIKRIPNNVSKGKFNIKNQPIKFTLGTGHIKFFYSRLLFLQKRYEKLYIECKNRGFNVQYYGSAWNNVPHELMNDYEPTEEDVYIVRERIRERLEKVSL